MLTDFSILMLVCIASIIDGAILMEIKESIYIMLRMIVLMVFAFALLCLRV